MPQYITIHVRHGDFGGWCGDVPVHECFAPLSAYERRVQEVKDELRERRGIVVQHVIMTADEQDEGWWESVREMGWLQVDYAREKTEEIYGKWSVRSNQGVTRLMLIWLAKVSCNHRCRDPVRRYWLCWNRPIHVLPACSQESIRLEQWYC